jgi:hypothetical protein
MSVKPKFELGLVMAGAVSAGSYTAGVLDFLFDALDQWYKSYDGNPPHDIKIKVMTGASAGGMCAGISAMQFLDKTNYSQPQTGKLYNSWVKTVDIEPMLSTKDLGNGKTLSLLDSAIIDDIADRAFNFSPDLNNIPPFVDDDLHLVLTITNTRGVSYAVKFEGTEETNPYIISNFGDFLHYAIRKPGCEPSLMDPIYNFPLLIDSNNPDPAYWNLLKELCKATGAFPLGLRARKIWQPNKEIYNLRYPPYKAVNIPKEGKFSFITLDGGVINNEPFTIGHDILAGRKDISNLHKATEANRAIIMVDPFPSSPVSLDYDDTKDDIVSVALAFFKSLRGQALFKPEDIREALDEKIYSRFLISPKRKDPRGRGKNKYHVAGGAVEAFSGFVHESYREHDYQLGRRNAQHFFRTHFTLADSNPLFREWNPELKQKIKTGYGQFLKPDELPIIPLPDSLWQEVLTPNWPTISQKDFDKKICDPMTDRVKALGNGLLSGGLISLIWKLGGHRVISRKVVSAFEKELQDAELIG